jgi:hypothetical protein
LNPFPDKQRELKTWISEDSGPSGSIRDCLTVARYFGLDKADTTRILKEVTTPVKNWSQLAYDKRHYHMLSWAKNSKNNFLATAVPILK